MPIRKNLHCYEWNIKGDSSEGSNEQSFRKELSLPRGYISGHRKNKAILVRSQMEKKNMEMETRERLFLL